MSSMFLNDNEETRKNDAMLEKIGDLRREQIMERVFPGFNVGGLGFHQSMSVADADFTVSEKEIRTVDGDHAVPSHKALVRDDKPVTVACVGKDYGTIQHMNALEGLDPLVKAGDLSMEKVHVSDGGATVVATALLGFSLVHQPGRDRSDALAHFARIRNSHGFGSAEAGLYTLRLVCLNGMTSIAALDRVRVSHTKYATQRVPNLHSSLANIIKSAREESEQFQQMADQRMQLEQFIEFSNEILTDFRGEADTDRKKARREKDVCDLTDLFCEGRGNLGETKYDAFNSFSDWLTARRDQYDESAKFAAKFASSETGAGRTIRARVMKKLLNR